MMNATRRIGLAVAVLGLMTGMASWARAGIVLTYEEVGVSNFVNANPDSQGFQHNVTLDVVDVGAGGPWGAFGPAHSGHYAIFNNYSGDGSITKAGGGTFDFIDLYIKSWFPSVAGNIQGYNGGSLVGSVAYSATNNAWVNVTGNFTGIDELRITQNGYFLVDDVQFGSAPVSDVQLGSAPVSAVPEPSSIALVCTALPMGLGFAWKRRRKAVTV